MPYPPFIVITFNSNKEINSPVILCFATLSEACHCVNLIDKPEHKAIIYELTHSQS